MILTTRVGETTIRIDDGVKVRVTAINGAQVRIAISRVGNDDIGVET